ncbi:hypothetical protein H0H93_007626 [Arthromyces matolae]|nr:hypothetical protein H0H93_007626 [Arthromyces matolae]
MGSHWTSYSPHEGPSYLPEDGRTLMISTVLDAGAQRDFEGVRVIIVRREGEGAEMACKERKICTVIFELAPSLIYWGQFARLILLGDTIPRHPLRILYDRVDYATSSTLFLHCSHSSQPEFSPGGDIRKPTRVRAHSVRVLPTTNSRPPSSTFNLPMTLLSRIIVICYSEKQKGWRRGLLACSLVCKSWAYLVEFFYDDFRGNIKSGLDHDPPNITTVARSISQNNTRGCLMKTYSPTKYLRPTRMSNVAFMAFCEAQNTILRYATCLVDLTLEYTHAFFFRELGDILRTLQQIRSLQITQTSRLGYGPHYMPDIHHFTFEEIRKFISFWPHLKRFRASNWKVPPVPVSWSSIANLQARLDDLTLGVGKLSGPLLLSLSGPSATPPTLRIVCLESITGITNAEFLIFLLRVAPTLEFLSVSACPMWRKSNEEEYAIDAAMPELVSLKNLVSDSDILTSKALSRKIRRRQPPKDQIQLDRLTLRNPHGMDLQSVVDAPGEGPISPQDARLLLAQRWLEKSPGGKDMFTLWDSLQPRQTSLQALVISILSALVILTSSHYTFQSLGHPILKTLFTPTYTRRLNSYIGGSNAELILVTLKLYNALSSFAGGREKKLVLEAFGWELKSLPKLLNMRRKSPSETTDALNKPGKFKKNFLNIRTLYILFLLSFILPESSTQVKTTFIEQHRDAFLSVFKGLLQDPHVVIRKLLEVCWVGLWEDQKIKRTTKISLFNEITISHLLKLYDRNAAEDDDPDHVPADLVHHFLLAICTRPGVGICFKDRGWYPRDNEGEADEEEAPTGKGGRVYNRILSNVVKTLKVNEDLRQQELALKMMAACPELVAGYWSGAALTLEPRLSSKWIANVSFLGNVISQPIPTSSFLLPSTPSSSTAGAGALYNPTPPPLSIIMENILPSAANTRAHFTRGLQSTSGLVQHCTALALAKCIGKFEEVTQALKSVEEGIGESDMEGEEGQWGRRRREVEREVRRRVPEFQVIVAFSQQKFDERCMKTPYRYLEDLQVLDVKGVSEDQDVTMTATAGVDVLPSPLLMTVLEQFQIKVTKATLSPSEVLAVASFVRKLVFRLKGKQQDLKFLRKVEERFDQMLHVDKLFPNYPVITSAIRREVDLLRATFSPTTKKKARVSSACELVDWIRLLDCQLGTEEIKRVVAIISKLYPPAISMILESLLPASGVWEGFNIPSIILEVQAHLPFEFLFLHAGAAQLVHDTSTEILAAAALSNLTDAKRAICHISHKLAREPTEDTVGLFLLLTRILNKASTALQPPDVTSLKETVFARSNVLGSYLISGSLPDTVREALHHFVHTTLDPANASDRALVTGPSSYWQEILMSGTVDNPTQIALASPWVSYLDMARLFTLFDSFASTTLTIGTAIVDVVLAAVKRAASSESGFEKELMQRLPQLLTLYTSNPSHLLEELIAIAIQGSLPVSHDGELHEKTLDELKLGSVLRQADSRWLRRLDHLPPKILGQAILNQKSWTSATLTICSSLLYSGHLSRNTFMTWLSTENSNSRTPEHLITVTHAFLDVAASTGDQINEDGAWKTVFTRILDWISDDELSEPIRSRGAHCVSLMMESMPPSVIKEFLAVLIQSVERLPVNSINPHLVLIGLHLHAHHRELAEEFIGKLVNHGIHWATRHFAKGVDTSCDMVIRNLTSLAHFASGLKSHLVETVLGAVIQNSLSQVVALEFVTALLPLVHLKPVVVNRHLQSILQHPSFYKYSGNLSPGNSSIRDAIVRLLYTLFHLHPSNTCQATHVEPLIRIYRGSLSKADGFILSIFRLFEKERKASISSLLCRWSPTPNLLSSSSLEALSGLDATIVLRTCLNFPMWRKIDDLTTENASMHDGQLYDPVFLMLAFAQMLAENPPQSAFAWVELFRTNIASLIIRALSSKDAAIRDVALCQLAGLWQYLENADLQERPHILHILTVLKDVIPPPSDDPPPRLPSYTTLLLSHALRGIFYPSNFIYPITARFLLQRPELDTHDVPMLYSMLYSSSDDCKKERGWIVRFLSDGMTSTDDWKVLKRRHTWDLLASLFQSCDGDRTFQASILEVCDALDQCRQELLTSRQVLANITCNVQAATSLVLKCGLLSWIEIQVVTASHGLNGVEWAKILDNITAIVDPGKLEAATAGEWRVAICRCLAALLDDFKSSNSATAFPLVVQTALRLTQIPGVPSINMTTLIDRLIKCLSVLETSIVLPQIPLDLPRSKTNSNCLHRSNSIHEGSNCEPLQSWGMCVEGLWRILMALEDKSESWDIVTSRILVWRAITGIVDGVPEWARRQVVCNMKYSRECSG